MKKDTVISFEKFKRYNFEHKDFGTIDFDDCTIIVKRAISLSDAMNFVANVVDICFSESGEYMPELKDFGIRLNVIARYTNLEINDNNSNVYEVLYGNDLFEAILNEIDNAQLKSIVYGIDQRIKLINDMNVTSFNNNMKTLQKQFEEFLNMFEDLFSGISKEDFATVAKAVSGGSISVEQLVRDRLEERKNQDGVGD